MSEITAPIPTIEQINLEHQLANSKAAEAVQHATNCGLMLLQVKASLKHGEWLPWLKQQQEAGLIGFSHMTATKYMRLAANINRDLYLESTSIRAALELLSDKEPEEQQGSLIDIEPTRARSEPPAAKPASDAETERRRAAEWREQWRSERDARRESEAELARLASSKNVEVIERVVERVVEPADYQDLKARARALERQLDAQRKSREHDVRVEVERHRLAQRRADEEAERKAAAAQQMMSTAQETMSRVRAVTGAHNRTIQAFVAAGRRLDDALAVMIEHPTPPSDESCYAAATLAARARLLADRLALDITEG